MLHRKFQRLVIGQYMEGKQKQQLLLHLQRMLCFVYTSIYTKQLTVAINPQCMSEGYSRVRD